MMNSEPLFLNAKLTNECRILDYECRVDFAECNITYIPTYTKRLPDNFIR